MVKFWWWANLFQILPLWLFFIPLLVLFIWALSLRLWKIVIFHGALSVLILVGIMGFQFSLLSLVKVSKPSATSIRILTMNLGQAIDSKKFNELIKNTHPDILAFQEVGSYQFRIINQKFSPDQWYIVKKGEFAVVSRIKIVDSDEEMNRFLNVRPGFIEMFRLNDGQRGLTLFNLHLETPREGVEEVISRSKGAFEAMKVVTGIQENESSVASQWVSSHNNVVVAGDFNMLTHNPIFHKFWSRYTDAFSSVGDGFGYTKYTSWYGVRIDHLLYDENWKAIKAFVGPDIGGDHRPLIVDLEFIGKQNVFVNNDELGEHGLLTDNNDYLVYEGFESSVGSFTSSPSGALNIDSGNTNINGKALKVLVKPIYTELTAGTKRDEWNLNNYNEVSFVYRIPPKVPISFRVQTRMGDWICLGGTETGQCTGAHANVLVELIDDNIWHEAVVDVLSSVESVLPEMHNATEFQFYIPENRHLGDHFWIDDFGIRVKLDVSELRLKNISTFKQDFDGVTDAVVKGQPIPKRYAVSIPVVVPVTKGEYKKIPIVKLDMTESNMPLVSTGVPFAQGQLIDEKDIAFFNDKEEEIPIAVKVLARWPQDQSIRSILVQFPYAIEHNFEYVTMRWGETRKTKDISIVTPDWDYPQAYILLGSKWLCLSGVMGEQLPMGRPFASDYDQRIIKNFPRIAALPLTGKLADDGYYSTPHGFYQFYVRSGEIKYFMAARKELLYYRQEQIIHEGKDKGMSTAGRNPRYLYIQAMLDDYLLTGDPRTYEVATDMVKFLERNHPPEDAFYSKKRTNFWAERRQAFPMLGFITYYEMSGEKKYLLLADKFMENLYKTQMQWPERGGFVHNLYAHDPEEGARPDEYGGSPFMTGLLLEAIVKYHQITGSDIAADSIFRALDWLINEGLASTGDSLKYLTADKYARSKGVPDLNLLVVHAFGYGYKISGYMDKRYLDVGMRLFKKGVQSGYLGTRKHFNQAHRSSGHFLAYIAGGLKSKQYKAVSNKP